MLSERIRAAIENLPVSDVHTHLDVDRPTARNFADILLYHHLWIELVSAGMPQNAVSKKGLPHEITDPEMAPEERVKACLPYFPFIRNTLSWYLLKLILRDLFGVPDGRLAEDNWREVYDRVNRRLDSEEHTAHFLSDRLRIRNSVSVEGPLEKTRNVQFDLAWELNGFFVHSHKRPQATVWSGLQELFGEIRDSSDVVDMVGNWSARGTASHLKAYGIWWPASIRMTTVSAEEVDRAVRNFNAGSFSPEDVASFASFSIREFFKAVRKTTIKTIQLIMGAAVKYPHRSMTNWQWDLTGWADIINEFEDLKFNLSTASDVYTQDVAVLAKHFPNVSVAGYWWHTLYPHYMRKSLEVRLDVLPHNKIIPFFSDAYHAEWCYPKLKLVKDILSDVLAERVSRGFYSEGEAVEIAARMLYRNGMEIYDLSAE